MPTAVLEAEHRLRNGRDFSRAVRTGSRAGSATLVCHVAPADRVRVGFIVPKSVGNAVTRNRVKRQLRHLMRARLAGLGHVTVVVRARPAAATAGSAALSADLRHCLDRATA